MDTNQITLIGQTHTQLINGTIEDFKEIVSEITGNKLKKFEIATTITNKETKDKIKTILSEKVIKIKFNETEIKAKIENHSYSYSGTEQENTEYTFRIKIDEQDPDLPPKWTQQEGTILQVLENYAAIKAIKELLIEKEIITKEEFTKKYVDIGLKYAKDKAYFITYGYEKSSTKKE
ncbi:hypothetical protein V6C27_13660 [Peptococcaceae bacterium 1198_IL3148]